MQIANRQDDNISRIQNNNFNNNTTRRPINLSFKELYFISSLIFSRRPEQLKFYRKILCTTFPSFQFDFFNNGWLAARQGHINRVKVLLRIGAVETSLEVATFHNITPPTPQHQCHNSHWTRSTFWNIITARGRYL